MPSRRLKPDSHTLAFLAAAAAMVVLWVFVPGEDTFREPKFHAWMALLGLIAAGCTLAALRGNPFHLALTPTVIGLLLFTLWAELSPAWASSDLLPRRALPMWWALLVTVLLTQHAVIAASRRDLHRIPLVLTLVVTIAALCTLGQDFGIIGQGVESRLADWRGTIPGVLGNTTHTADLLVFGLLVGLFLFAHAGRASEWTVVLVLIAVITAALIVCFSFHSDLSLIVGALVIAIGIGSRRWRHLILGRWPRWALLLAVWAGLLIFYLANVPGNPHAPGLMQEAMGSERLAWGWGSRLAIWSNSLAAIAERPWLGWGIGCFTHAFPQQFSAWVATNADPQIMATAGRWTNAAHNEILHVWVELGIVGLAIAAGTMIFHLRACVRLMRHRRRTLNLAGLWLLALTLVWLVQAQMNFPLSMPVGRMALGLLLGAAAGLEVMSRREADRPVLSLSTHMGGWRFAVATALIAVLAMAPLHAAWQRHVVIAMRRMPYEVKRSHNQQREAALQQGISPLQLARMWEEQAESWVLYPQAPPVDLAAALGQLSEILRRDPGDTDARSTLHNMQLPIGLDLLGGARMLRGDDPRRAEWEREGEAWLRASITTGHEVLRGLAEAEVHRRLAQAHGALGEEDLAREEWLRFYAMTPINWQSPPLMERLQSDPEFRRRWESGEGE